MTRLRIAMAVSTALAACAPDLRTDYPFDGKNLGAEEMTNHVVVEDRGGNLKKVTVDATSKTAFVYLDLDTLTELAVDAALDTGNWDLRFQRFLIAANGGGGGPGVVEVAAIKDGNFDGLSRAPSTGFQQDGSETVFNGVQGGWYYYDLGTHKLTVQASLFYVVKSGAGAYFKIRMLNYYDEAGTPARLSFEVAPVLAP